LQDREQAGWLIECLDDSTREWVPIAAAEALRAMTGEDHGMDPVEWRKATGESEGR
jgi:hypothetical protein